MYACVYLCVCTCVHVCACVPAQVESLYSPGTSGSRVRVGGSVRGRQDVAHRSRSLSLPPAGPGVPGGGACAIFLLVPLARSQSVVLTQWDGQINGDLLCLLCLRDGRLLLSVAVRMQPVCAAAGGAARPGEGCPTLPPLSHPFPTQGRGWLRPVRRLRLWSAFPAVLSLCPGLSTQHTLYLAPGDLCGRGSHPSRAGVLLSSSCRGGCHPGTAAVLPCPPSLRGPWPLGLAAGRRHRASGDTSKAAAGAFAAVHRLLGPRVPQLPRSCECVWGREGCLRIRCPVRTEARSCPAWLGLAGCTGQGDKAPCPGRSRREGCGLRRPPG